MAQGQEGRARAERVGAPVAGPCAACAVRPMVFCSALEGGELGALLGILGHVALEPHDTLFYEGDPADQVYNVTAGTVKLYKLLPDGRRQITGFLFAGDFLGIARRHQYAYTAEAVTKVALCRFPRSRLERLFEAHPKMEKRLLAIASDELAAAQDQILLLGRKTALEKIASFLLMLSERQARRGLPAVPVQLPMSRADIADYLGLTTETVSRTFTQLRRRNVIRLDANNLVSLPDPEAVAACAEGG